MNRSEAFAQFGAKLKNFVWSVAAETPDGDLVLSLWKQFFKKPKDGEIRYVDCVTRWSGNGNTEFRKFLDSAAKSGQVIRVVIARTEDEAAVAAGQDASELKNTFHARKDWVGRLDVWDGENFEIAFRSEV
jgi:hypothetical protein